MRPEGAVAAETAAAKVSLAKGVPLQSRCMWYHRILSPLGERSCACRLQLLLAVSFLVQQLPQTDHRVSIMVFCAAVTPERPSPEGFPSTVASSARQGRKEQLSSEASGPFAKMAPAATSTLRRSLTPDLLPASPPAGTHLQPAPPVEGREWDDSDSMDFRESEPSPESRPMVTQAARDFIYAMNALLGTAKWEAASRETKGTRRSATSGHPSLVMGWSLRNTESEEWDARGARSMRRNEVLAERPAWLLPEHKPSLLTTKYVAQHESGTCPVVGGFGHPIGREFEGLENWDELLCRSGGVLRKTNSPDLTYDTLVLVKGYRGGDAPLDETSTTDDLSSSAESTSVDGISGRRRPKMGLSFGTSRRSRSWRITGATSEAQQKGIGQSRESSGKNTRPRYRKTDAELEDELSEVVDLLSMLHCHLANVVDLRHPSNFQLYANIRQVALLRSTTLGQRKKATVQLSDQQGLSAGTAAKQQVQGHGSNTPRFPSNAVGMENDLAKEGGIMRGQSVSTGPKFTGATYAPRDEENSDMRQQKRHPHEPARRGSSRAFLASRASYSPRRKETEDAKVAASSHAADLFEFGRPSSTSSPLGGLDEGHKAESGETNVEDSVLDEEADDSGPVLVVVRSLSAPERLYFGAREIKEFLFSRLLETAYEVQAYNEFRHSIFALVKRGRNTLFTRRKSAADVKRGLLNGETFSQRPSSTQERSVPTSGVATVAPASRAGRLSEEGWGNAAREDTTSSSPVEGSTIKGRQKRASLVKEFPVTGWTTVKGTNPQGATPAGERVALGVDHDGTRARRRDTGSTERDATLPNAETSRHTVEAQEAEPEPFAAGKERPWWAPLGLRFDLYVSFAGVTPDRVMVSPTASLLRLVSKPRMRTLVCVYNYDDPKTDIPPVLRGSGFVGLPALVLGRRVTTGARNIERLLVSIVEFKPPVSYSLEQYAPRFLVTEPIFSEVLAAATVSSEPATEAQESFKHNYTLQRETVLQS